MSRKNLQKSKKNGIEFRSNSVDGGINDTKKVQQSVPSLERIPLRAEPTAIHDDFQEASGPNKDSGFISSGRRSSPRARNPNGAAFREARSRGDSKRPNFNIAVPANGYAWWYVDGLSYDGAKAISIIGFIGSVFSPWYAWSGRKNPHNHCCINVAMYGKGWRWTMTERGEESLRQSKDQLKIGPSSFTWDKGKLIIDINEMSSPHLDRVIGKVTITPKVITSVEVNLTSDGSHIWRPFAPNADIHVEIEKKGWDWKGHGYFDANFGTRALEQDFSYWTWSRLPCTEGSIAFYDAIRRKEEPLSVSLKFHSNGRVEEINAPPEARLSRSLWAVKRRTRSDNGYQPTQVKHMLDAPFYTRSAIKTKIYGEETIGVHEALDLDRFSSPLLKPFLAVRVPRTTRWKA
jgi:carotenoid 1,2-hydratase